MLIVLLGPTVTPFFSLSEHIYGDEYSSPSTWTGLQHPQNSLMIVGKTVSFLVHAKSTESSVAFQENVDVILSYENPLGTSGTAYI